jgi:hypothetical protein
MKSHCSRRDDGLNEVYKVEIIVFAHMFMVAYSSKVMSPININW